MEPVTVMVSGGIGLLVGLVGGWFAGGYYKSKRVQGMTKDEIKVLTEDRAKAYFGVVLNEIKKLKSDPPKT